MPSLPSPVAARLIVITAKWALLGPALLGFVTVLRRRKWRCDGIEAIIAGSATIVIVKISAALYSHARPFVVLHTTPLIAHIPDNAFPSDHLAACGLTVGFLWSRSRAAALVAAAFALALGTARVMAGLHWPIDVELGFIEGLVGSSAGWITAALITPNNERENVRTAIGPDEAAITEKT